VRAVVAAGPGMDDDTRPAPAPGGMPLARPVSTSSSSSRLGDGARSPSTPAAAGMSRRTFRNTALSATEAFPAVDYPALTGAA